MKLIATRLPVLILSDNESTVDALSSALRQHQYPFEIAVGRAAAIEAIRSGRCNLVIVDETGTELPATELCRQIRTEQGWHAVYVILLTPWPAGGTTIEAIDAGADECLSVPIRPAELLVRLRTGERQLSWQSRDAAIFSLVKLAESRDLETGAHLDRVREYCRVLAEHLSEHSRYRTVIDREFIELIYRTSPLHDIGKMGVPDRVLLKPDRLDDDEIAIIREHTVIGGYALDAAAVDYPTQGYLQMARDIAWYHHERYDGGGYPRKLAGDEIPLAARIVALADVYDALTTQRVYRHAFNHETAREIILDERGKQFDPDVVDAFCACADRFADIRSDMEQTGIDSIATAYRPAMPAVM